MAERYFAMQKELRTAVYPHIKTYLKEKGKRFSAVQARLVPDDYEVPTAAAVAVKTNQQQSENEDPMTRRHQEKVIKRIKVSLIRHGEGFHNVACEEWRKDPTWDGKSDPYTIDNDPNWRYWDAMLTAVGEQQAKDLQPRVEAMLMATTTTKTKSVAPPQEMEKEHEEENQTIPMMTKSNHTLPFLLIVSPLRRAVETGLIAFDLIEMPTEVIRHQQLLPPRSDEVIIIPTVPVPNKHPMPVICKAIEWCHERGAAHTCDKRLPRTHLQTMFTNVDFSSVTTEEDPLWHDSDRETLYQVSTRCVEFLDTLLTLMTTASNKDSEEEQEYSGVAVASHSGFLLCLHNAVLTPWDTVSANGGDDDQADSFFVDAALADKTSEWYHTGEMRTLELAFVADGLVSED